MMIYSCWLFNTQFIENIFQAKYMMELVKKFAQIVSTRIRLDC